MDLGKKKIERVKFPLRKIERKEAPAVVPSKTEPAEEPILVPNWPMPVKVPQEA